MKMLSLCLSQHIKREPLTADDFWRFDPQPMCVQNFIQLIWSIWIAAKEHENSVITYNINI